MKRTSYNDSGDSQARSRISISFSLALTSTQPSGSMPLTLDNLDVESLSSTLSTPPSPGSPTHTLHRLDKKSSVRPYESKDAYLFAMREDLAEWFNDLYNTQLTADNLVDNLRDGTFLCLHANNVKSYIDASGSGTQVPDLIYRFAICMLFFPVTADHKPWLRCQH